MARNYSLYESGTVLQRAYMYVVHVAARASDRERATAYRSHRRARASGHAIAHARSRVLQEHRE